MNGFHGVPNQKPSEAPKHRPPPSTPVHETSTTGLPNATVETTCSKTWIRSKDSTLVSW